MLAWLEDLSRRAPNRALRECFQGKYSFSIDQAGLSRALLAGANPDSKVAWLNSQVGGSWLVPVLVATTLTKDSMLTTAPLFDETAADNLLAAGADPHKIWKGRRYGIGWSFAQWVYETGCEEGWNLLKKHRIDMRPALSFHLQQPGQMPSHSPNRALVRHEIESIFRSEMEALVLSRETAVPASPSRPRSPRL